MPRLPQSCTDSVGAGSILVVDAGGKVDKAIGSESMFVVGGIGSDAVNLGRKSVDTDTALARAFD